MIQNINLLPVRGPTPALAAAWWSPPVAPRQFITTRINTNERIERINLVAHFRKPPAGRVPSCAVSVLWCDLLGFFFPGGTFATWLGTTGWREPHVAVAGVDRRRKFLVISISMTAELLMMEARVQIRTERTIFLVNVIVLHVASLFIRWRRS